MWCDTFMLRIVVWNLFSPTTLDTTQCVQMTFGSAQEQQLVRIKRNCLFENIFWDIKSWTKSIAIWHVNGINKYDNTN